jgi:hypothetical protein
MFTGFPSTQTPNVQWWDLSKIGAVSEKNNISLTNDCAPVQYFATGGTSTDILVYLPPNPTQGKTITLKNDRYTANTQAIVISDSNNSGQTFFNLGQGSSITCCYISQNTLTGAKNFNWVITGGGSSGGPLNINSISIGGFNNHAIANSSGILGGNANTASGQNSAVAGGAGSLASALDSAILGGSTNTASATFSGVCLGNFNTASANNAVVAGGASNSASGLNSIVLGGSNSTASGIASVILGGTRGTTRSISGSIASQASDDPITATAGVSQLAMLILARQTTDATATVLASNASAAAATNQIALPNNSAYYFRGEVIAGVTGAGDSKGWYIEGLIKRGANAAATSVVGTPTVTSLYADTGAATWSVAVAADTTLGCLKITVTGQAATTIRWVAQVRTTEMTY